MVVRRRHGVRQAVEAELREAGQEGLVVLVAEHVEQQLGGGAGPAPRDSGEDQAGEPGVIEPGDGLVVGLHDRAVSAKLAD